MFEFYVYFELAEFLLFMVCRKHHCKQYSNSFVHYSGFLHHSEVNKFVKILICSMKAQIWSEWQIPFFKSILAAVFFNLSDDSIQTSTILLHLDNSVNAPDGEKH